MSRRSRTLERRNVIKKSNGSTKQSVETTSSKKTYNTLLKFYKDKYKELFLIPVIMLVLSLCVLGFNFASTGSVIDLGVSITGGISITAQGDIGYTISEIESELTSKYPSGDISIRKLSDSDGKVGISIEAAGVPDKEFIEATKALFGENVEYAFEQTGSSLGSSFFKEMLIALVFAFICMGIVVFVSFRSFVPSFAVILSAASDMIVTLAIISLMNVRLSLAGIATFLMLIGYSVDTDILLTTRVLKRKRGSVFDRILSAVETGFIMNLTTLIAVGLGYTFSQSPVLKQIMMILFIGLVVDMINTWIQNVGILRWYLERKPKAKAKKEVDSE